MALGVRVQGSPTDIEDIVHDAFLRVHDRLDTLRAGSSFRPWLASVVVSLVRTRMRKRRMLSLLGLSSADPIDLDALVSHDAGPEARAQIAQVYALLRGVPVDQAICWTLRYVEGRKLEEVAEVAKCSLATAKRRIAQVQQQMLLLDSQGAHSGTSSWFQGEPWLQADETSTQEVES
jgi:RNA polymerase sigma-70 factor (ECF subfamily)